MPVSRSRRCAEPRSSCTSRTRRRAWGSTVSQRRSRGRRSSPVTEVLLGLGSNLGDRLATLQRAVELLASHGVRAVASSRVWATSPLGGPGDQPEFLNAVIRVDPGPLGADEVLAVIGA